MNQNKDWSLPENIEILDLLPDEFRGIFLESIRCKKTLETLLEVTDDFIYIKDLHHKFIYTSDAFAKLTQHQSWRELVGKDDFDIFPAEHAEIYFTFEKSVIQDGEKLIQHEEPYHDPQGNLRWVSSTKNPVFDAQNNVIGLVGISKDITELKEQQQKIKQLATHDDLTGLFNRRALFELGELFLKKADRDLLEVAILFIDLDKFKNINDVHGHRVGDDVLTCFASHLKKCVRQSDLVARIGGDEFIICMTATEKIQAAAKHCANRVHQIDDENLKGCGCSIGITITKNNYNLINLLSEADKAMYKAKQGHSPHITES
jgi:diguanylate cyclase (GGDEF)-like protein/PAS domain S-box-containing protein